MKPRLFSARRAFLLACALSLVLRPAGAAEGPVVVTILQTTDLHGHLLPWDYPRAQAADEGLARVASRIAAIRRETPNVLLLDAGDTIQGTPVEYLHAKSLQSGPDPMSAAMSAVRYDAMAVGNHEFNFGLAVLRKAQKEASFPWLSANTRNADGSAAFPEYIVKTVAGVRIGVLGLTTPNIPNWEPERNRPGLTWEDPVVTVRRLVPVLRGREKCDFVAILIHSGPELDLKTGEPDGTDAENRVVAVSKVPGIDLLLTGHTHRRIPLTHINGVPMIQPGRWGDVLARVDVTFTRGRKGWTVAGVTGELLPSVASLALDPAVVAIATPHDGAARAYMDERIAVADGDFPGARARLEDSALLDFVSDTMLRATGADLAMTSLLPGRFEGWPKGPISVRQVYGLYPYENQLVAVEIDGAALKACLERAAEFYGASSWEGGRLVLKPRENMIPYNFDVVQGATYRIDPTAPVGGRVKDLAFHGRSVAPGDRFTLAVNSYRAQGSGGYTALKGARVVKDIPDEIRELLIARLRELGHVSPVTDHNWIVAPDAVWAPEGPRRPAAN
ncbi:MAG TPA: bifunctional UDP-sugar hydrolase/5'-nucleotidase [Thermoanaerobaculia bacterium]|nr:bifunctional UDP-sugar hydrolase/5'-nucleotidase [Thermoanaerobaculia bacterium]